MKKNCFEPYKLRRSKKSKIMLISLISRFFIHNLVVSFLKRYETDFLIWTPLFHPSYFCLMKPSDFKGLTSELRMKPRGHLFYGRLNLSRKPEQGKGLIKQRSNFCFLDAIASLDMGNECK